jgi:hypothetical protein
MKVTEQHSTPDGLLKFIVEDYGDDIALGFNGFPWHTHPECLPPFSKSNPKETIQRFIAELLSDRKLIGLCRKNGKLIDAWVTDTPELDKYKPADEEIEFRYWSGRKYENSVQ